MKRIIILIVFVSFFKIGNCCPTFYFHITHNGSTPLTFSIEDMNNPSDVIQVISTLPNGLYSVSAQGFSGTLGHPCGVNFGSNICYKIKCTTGPANADYIVVKFNGANPNNAIFEYDVSNGTFSLGTPGNSSAYTYTISNPSLAPPLCATCYTLAYIHDNYLDNDGVNQYNQPVPAPNFFNIPFLETIGVIVIESTIISATSTVRLDANPMTGSIQLLPGFATQLGAIFIAQALDGCGPLIPR